MKLVTLHGPDGQEVLVNPDVVAFVRSALAGIAPNRATTEIMTDGGQAQFVKETPHEVKRLLERGY